MNIRKSPPSFLDYGYTEEGHLLLNFGVEGESYEMIDGYAHLHRA